MSQIAGNAGFVVTCFICCAFLQVAPIHRCASQTDTNSTYVGSEACLSCHEAEYESYQSRSKKAHSYDSIKKMQPHLTEAEFQQCFECHTTGYGKPGGFNSEHESPNLRNAGCEVCHGPGSRHVDTGEAEDIQGKITAATCEICHNQERVEAFNYTPLVYGGGH